MEEEQESIESTPENLIDIHDIDTLKKLWFVLRDAQKSAEVFTIVQLLIDSLPYDFIDKEDNWLHMAHLLEEHGETELSSLFKLANQRAFQLSLKGV
ncbi:MAG: hypothetical protein ACAI44_35000 [Candidatus Sericytochromatia bacterium]